MHLREAFLQARAEIEEILKRQVGMQSADNVKFRDRLGVSGGRGLESFLQRHGVGAGRIFLAAEGAQTAGGHADVGGIDVAVDVKVRLVPVHALANVVGHPSHREDVAGSVQREGVIGGEALAGHHFRADGLEARVVSLKCMILNGVRWSRRRHRFDNIAGECRKLLSVISKDSTRVRKPVRNGSKVAVFSS